MVSIPNTKFVLIAAWYLRSINLGYVTSGHNQVLVQCMMNLPILHRVIFQLLVNENKNPVISFT